MGIANKTFVFSDLPIFGYNHDMIKIYLDPPTVTKLDRVDGAVELCDASGRTLGYFHPIADGSEYESAEPPISEEELRARASEVGGLSTAEVLAYLNSLPPQGNS